jgi:hypothetical protein
MTTKSSRAVAVSYAFGPFKPSNRQLLLKILAETNGEELFVAALEVYLETWANDDWLEDYSVERIGIWTKVNGSTSLVALVKTMIAKNQQRAGRNRAKTYAAILRGLTPIQATQSAMQPESTEQAFQA